MMEEKAEDIINSFIKLYPDELKEKINRFRRT